MKKIHVFLLVLALIPASCSSPTPSQTPTPIVDSTPIPWEDRTIFKGGLVQSAQPVLEELDGASVYHIQLGIARNMYDISGRQEVRYTNTETIPLDEVRFRLFPNILGGEMDVSNLKVDGTSVTPQLEMNNSLMIVPFSEPLQPGGNAVIEMDFQVTVPQEVGRNYGVFAYSEDVLALAHAYPMVAVYDDEGWNAEIPPQSGDVTYADAAFFVVDITAPVDVTIVTTGSELERTESGDTQSIRVASGPARDFYLAASPNYEVISKTTGETTIRSFAPPGFEDGASLALDVAVRAVEVFGNRYAPYPYTEFDIVSTPTLALGIEYPGMTAIASRIYDIDQIFGTTPVSVYMESTVAHETGHMWFYNLVGNDQLDDPWLDESLTQFVTLQYYEDQYGEQGAEGFGASLNGRWSAVGFEEIPIGLPVAAYEDQEYGAIVYGRGPLFFVALQETMGREAFDAFLRDYTETLSWDIATSEVLQSLAEQHCACDLDQIFTAWVYP